LENGLINMMEKKGYQISIVDEEYYTNYDLILSTDRITGGRINFLKDKNNFFSQVHLKKILFRFFSEEEIVEMLEYIRDDNPLLISFSNLKDIELKGYVPIKKMDKNIEKALKTFDVRMVLGNNLTSKEDGEQLKNKVDILRSLEPIIKDLENNHLLFYYHEHDEFDYSFNINGIDMKAFFKVIQNDVFLMLESSTEKEIKKINIKTKESVKEELLAFIKKAEQKNRIKNVMNPSKFFFNWWTSENDLMDEEEKIYEVFLKTFSPVEIEKICATVLKSDGKYQIIDKGQHLMFYEKNVIVMNEQPLHVWVFENDEKTHQRIKTQLLKLKEKQLDQTLHTLLQKEGVK